MAYCCRKWESLREMPNPVCRFKSVALPLYVGLAYLEVELRLINAGDVCFRLRLFNYDCAIDLWLYLHSQTKVNEVIEHHSFEWIHKSI